MKTRAILYSLSLALLGACAGSDGEDDGVASSYRGKSTAATINRDNAAAVTHRMLNGLGTGSQSQSSAGTSMQGLNNQPLGKVATRVVESSFVLNGPCGGSMRSEIRLNDAQTRFVSSATTFDNYCQNDNITNGTVSSTNVDNVLLAISFDQLSFQDTARQTGYVMNGSGDTAFSFNDNAFRLTLDSAVIDVTPASNQYLLEDFTYTQIYPSASEYSSYQMIFQGRLFESGLGFVDVTTLSNFQFNTNVSVYPSAGQLQMVGANSETLILTAIERGRYQLDVDEDGDGNIDSSDTGNWQDLQISFLFQ